MDIDKNIVSIIIILAAILPIIKGILFGISQKSLKRDLFGIEIDIAFIVALLYGIQKSKDVFYTYEEDIFYHIFKSLPINANEYLDRNPRILYFIFLLGSIFLIYGVVILIFKLLNKIVIYPAIDLIINIINKSPKIIRSIIGGIISIPRGIFYGIVFTLLFFLMSFVNVGENFQNEIANSKVYNGISSKILTPVIRSNFAKDIPNILANTLRMEVIKEGNKTSISDFLPEEIVYYNGVTLDEGVRSSDEIDKFSREIVKNSSTTREKAEKFYNWISTSIDFDDEKAEKLLSKDYRITSGAIDAYETRKGVCFDYSALFIAFARANDMKVRMVTGEGYSGINWVSHAWNQVYVEEEDKWINVDATFGRAGNYFDNKTFDIDHRNSALCQ